MKKIIVGLMVASLTVATVGAAQAGSRENQIGLGVFLGALGGLFIGSQYNERRHNRHLLYAPRPGHRAHPGHRVHRTPQRHCETHYHQRWTIHGWVPVPRTNCWYR